ncbi:Membrane steroid-binding protein 1 like [Verticillium longisporum]|uniref:Membrane steroid-binding protein 1 like n=1 Tax=Verticillium longisporum TaxID=100787 RepID=A0A8I2ZR13_VERLO|nr:Membrane steroid-binding protein 1 like [Verticillium longisporum]KAG7135921.1 Membrane steroid-binding protein 1 like [Verticillium longisporum]
MAEAPTAQQRKKEPVAIPIVPDEECGSEDEDNLFAGTPSEKLSRKSKSKSKSKSGTKAKAARTDDGETDAFSPLIDVLRVLSFLAVASCALSYVMSSGESFTWGFNDKPWYLRPSYWKLRWNGPLYLTPAELRAYDGTTPDTPIYLAINHTIYDVSANPRSYGPGGSYHLFAGHDASRAFVTGCFAEDRVPDMRGVETMYLPLDDADVDRHWSYAELEALRAAEREAAAQKVHDALKHWVDFFGNSDRYQRVGYVRLPEGWPAGAPVPRLCDKAQKGRVKRKLPGQEEEERKAKEERRAAKKREKEAEKAGKPWLKT